MRRKIYLILAVALLAGAVALLSSDRLRGWVDLAALYFGQGGHEMTAEEKAIFAVDDAASFGEDPAEALHYRLLAARVDGEQTGALIEVDGRQEFYREGESLHGSDVRLAWVLEDAVLLERHGAFRLLWRRGPWDRGERFTVPAPTRTRPAAYSRPPFPRVADFREDPAVSRLAGNYRERLYRNPLSLMGAINIQVTREHNGQRTFRLYPGTDTRAFERFGLEAGDEVVGVNGLDLNEADAISDLYQQLGDAPHLTLTLRRNEKTLVALYAFGE